LNPGTGRWTAADPLTQSVTRNGALGAEPWLRVVGGGLPIPDPEAPRYAYVDARPTVGADPSGLTVIYVGVGATAAVPGSGFNFGVGVAQGGSPFSYALGLTTGFATQVYKLVNVGLSVDFSLFWGLDPDEACSIRGPFMTLSMDPGLGASVSMVWSITWDKVQAFAAGGSGVDFSAALGPPVGLTISPGLLPTSWLPAAGVTWFATWSWIPYSINCRCN
jgi:hypothetical protein